MADECEYVGRCEARMTIEDFIATIGEIHGAHMTAALKRYCTEPERCRFYEACKNIDKLEEALGPDEDDKKV